MNIEFGPESRRGELCRETHPMFSVGHRVSSMYNIKLLIIFYFNVLEYYSNTNFLLGIRDTLDS